MSDRGTVIAAFDISYHVRSINHNIPVGAGF